MEIVLTIYLNAMLGVKIALVLIMENALSVQALLIKKWKDTILI